jgi:alanyl-tRNA synthetase
MFTKESLKKEFSANWKEQYEVELFKEKDFMRKHCPKCGKFFWTLDPDRELCGDPPCQNYGFIGKPITKKKLDYIETWKEFESFFIRNGHATIPRYPVVDRWRPDLFFTIASIQDFQRIDRGNIVMEYPADPLIIPQVCLRFPDIANVGVTGRHHTSFMMSGQHSFGNYWKDRCIELNFGFLNGVLGIPEDELVYTEDVWAMPDFSQFGPCLETFSRGLELVNSVFSQYTARGQSYVELPQKVIDVGWGHERLVWFSNGTHTGYDAVFGPVIKWMRAKAGIKETQLFDRYAVLAGSLDVSEKNPRKVREEIAKKLGISVRELNEVIEPMQALYAIADHTKTLLFALTDGSIPSNVGGGYNLRVILRRALSFLNDYDFGFTLDKVAELHAAHLKPLFPELRNGLGIFSKILEVEKDRYEKTMEKATSIVHHELKSGLTHEKMVKLYTSHGITPELFEKVAKNENVNISMPDDLYSRITAEHMVKEKDDETAKISVTGIPATKLMYYENPHGRSFSAKVVKKTGNWLALDRTFFYAEGGGQLGDRGTLKAGSKEYAVEDVQKIGDVVLHKVAGLREGQVVHGEVDWERRTILMRMHTGTHLVAGAARKIIGPHIWQAGAHKGLDVSRLDLTHYKPFTQDELEKIESAANDAVKRNLPVDIDIMTRSKAEGKYGFILYQGGASPGKTMRVVSVSGFDVEACGGTHVRTTGEVELIKIVRSERIQDGVNRLVFACGEPAIKFVRYQQDTHKKVMKTISSISASLDPLLRAIPVPRNVTIELQAAADVFSVSPDKLLQTIERFSGEITSDHNDLNAMRKQINHNEIPLEGEEFFRVLARKKAVHLSDLCEIVFELWKQNKKEAEKYRSGAATEAAERLLAKEKDGQVFDIIAGERKELIETASQLLKVNPKLTVILANHAGDIIVMSRSHDSLRILKRICEKTGGRGGGSKELAQGKVDIQKLLKSMGR